MKDDMKKESKVWILPLILFLILTIITNIALGLSEQKKDLIVGLVIFSLFSLYFCYAFLEAFVYTLKIDDDIVTIKTLFTRKKFKLNEISFYNIKKTNSVKMHQVIVILKSKKRIIFYTHYNDELTSILNTNNH